MKDGRFAITDLKGGSELREDGQTVCLSPVRTLKLGYAYYPYRLELVIGQEAADWVAVVFGKEIETEIDERGEALAIQVSIVPEVSRKLIAGMILRLTDERGVSPRPNVEFSTTDPTRPARLEPHEVFPQEYAG